MINQRTISKKIVQLRQMNVKMIVFYTHLVNVIISWYEVRESSSSILNSNQKISTTSPKYCLLTTCPKISLSVVLQWIMMQAVVIRSDVYNTDYVVQLQRCHAQLSFLPEINSSEIKQSQFLQLNSVNILTDPKENTLGTHAPKINLILG